MAKKLKLTDIDLTDYHLDDLNAHSGAVIAAIAEFETRKRNSAKADLEALAAKLGYKTSDLFGSVAGGKPKGGSKLPPKYYDKKSGATWSGRGRLPVWMKAHLDRGGKKGDLLI